MNDQLAQLALRSHALGLVVSTTGSTSLGATGSTYTRAAGSFLTDGFAVGMEITASGFTTAGNNGLAVVKAVAATVLTVNRTLTTNAAAASRTISVGLPSRAAWENQEFDPTPGSPWVREEFVGGPRRMLSVGESGTIEFDPLYHLDVSVPDNSGIGAPNRYAAALLSRFRPLTSISASDGSVIRVRTDAGPYRGALRHIRPGFASVRVTVPLRVHFTNA